jgi:hypothetical protein
MSARVGISRPAFLVYRSWLLYFLGAEEQAQVRRNGLFAIYGMLCIRHTGVELLLSIFPFPSLPGVELLLSLFPFPCMCRTAHYLLVFYGSAFFFRGYRDYQRILPGCYHCSIFGLVSRDYLIHMWIGAPTRG